jgi:uncharacterized protein (TIGR00375 family)
MKVIADFHTHSRFAMACSSNITINGMEKASVEKGINLIGTSDFLHGQWLSELKSNLKKDGDTGFFEINGSDSNVRFILTGEVSTIFTGNDKRVKKIHHIIMLPDFESVDSLKGMLSKYGNLETDGRPQLSMSAAHLLEEVFKVNKSAFVFPAHAWTPYFGVFGSLSGFNSMKDAYEDQEKHIYALETGLSSDPVMNWRISWLDKYALLSNSDMHSLPKLGREANVFELEEKEFNYNDVTKSIKEKDIKHLKSTIEFYPEEGKYHFDGHKECKFSVDPSTGISVCKICGKRLIMGVLHRVNELADRQVGFRPDNAIPYVNMVPLLEVVAYVMHKNTFSVVVEAQYRKMLESLGTEFHILIDANLEKIEECSSKEIAQAISNVRNNKIEIVPGYAGVFGELELLDRENKHENNNNKQKSLF